MLSLRVPGSPIQEDEQSLDVTQETDLRRALARRNSAIPPACDGRLLLDSCP